ncbi:hypothetical protein YPPY11_3713, partial [Yersinia pestis PY-11]
MAPAVATTGF